MSGTNRLRDLTRAQRTAVMEKAIELSERASVEDTEAWVAAAAELGIERAVLLEAHQAVQREARHQEGPQTRAEIVAAGHDRMRRRRRWTMAIIGAGIVTLGVAGYLRDAPTPASSSSTGAVAMAPFSAQLADEAGRWSVWSQNATLEVGTATVQGQSAVRLTLAPLGASGIANYRTTKIHGDVSGLDSLELELWSTGVARIQPSFRRSKHAQWSLPPVTLTPGRNDLVVKLDEFRYQERAGKGKPWKSKGSRSMQDVELFQLKVGKGVNTPGTAGTLDLVRMGLQ